MQLLLQKFVGNKKLHQPLRFAVSMAVVYTAWRIFKYFAEHYDNFLWGGWEKFQNLLGNFIAASTVTILQFFGYSIHHNGRMIMVDGARPIFVADLCLGIAPLVIFTGFILVFGNHHKNKIWFIPFGLSLILLINILRMLALVLVLVHYNQYFGMAHDYVYVVITYGLIFLLIMWWMEKLAFRSTGNSNTAQ